MERTDKRYSGELHAHSAPAPRIAVYAAVIFVLAVFETAFLPRFAVMGATPSLLLALTCASAFFDGRNTGIAVGVAAGFLSDALCSVGLSVKPLEFLAIGWFVGFMSERLGHDRDLDVGSLMGHFSIWLGAAAGIGLFSDMIILLLTAGKFNVFSAIWHILLPSALATFICGWPVCLVYLLILKKKLTKGKARNDRKPVI